MTSQPVAEVKPTPALSTRSRTASGELLRGFRLLVVRLVWVALALAFAGLFIAGVPAELALLRQVCVGSSASCLPTQLTPEGARLLPALGFAPAEYATILVALDIFSVCCWYLVALVLFLRRSADRMALFSALTLVAFGVGRFSLAPSAFALTHPQWTLAVDGARFLGSACLSVFVYIFPGGHFTPGWIRWIALAWIAPQLGEFFLPSTPFDLTRMPPLLQLAGFLGFVISAIFAQIYRYHRISTPLQQRQTRWVVFGMVVSLVGYLALAFALPLLTPSVTQPGTAANLATQAATTLVMLMIPLSIGIAILRARLFDIDVLINRALVYGTLTAVLAALYAACVVSLQAVFHGLIRFIPGSQITIVASTLAAIALFQPLRHRIQRAIDRGFYRHKYDADKTLSAFSTTLRSELDLDELRAHLLQAVHETMHPTHTSLWLLSSKAAGHAQHAHDNERLAARGDGTGDDDVTTLLYTGHVYHNHRS